MRPKPERLLVYYLFHSGFAVVTDSHVLMFDYYRDSPSEGGITLNDVLAEVGNRHVVVFVSHSHHDHFTPEIWQWRHRCAKISYVTSADVEVPQELSAVNEVVIVDANSTYHVDSLRVSTYASTDEGVAFLVEVDGYRIYHAGDLNWWHWEGEPEADNLAMAEKYRQQVDMLPKDVDIAFVVVDPRLEHAYRLGLTYFMSRVQARLIFPMHFGEDYTIFPRLQRDLSAEQLSHIAEITPSPLPFFLVG